MGSDPRCITTVTPTLCALMGIGPPAACGDRPLEEVVRAGREALSGPARKVLVYAADAIGQETCRRYGDILAPFERQAPLTVPLRSVMPTVTPVCYASIFSGALPEVHGIREYTKPVLAIETPFDALVAAGRSVAIVAVTNCSIDRIFRERPLTYYSEPDDEAVIQRAIPLLDAGEHDFVVAYAMAYDEEQHRSTPYSETADAALRGVACRFERLAQAFDAGGWRGHPRALLVAPDHGGHIGPNGRGTHGSDLPEDILVQHWYGFRAGSG